MTGITGKNASKITVFLVGAGFFLTSCQTEPEIIEPAPVGDGEIVVDVTPDSSNAPWTLHGPGGSTLGGRGDQTLPSMTPGEYSVEWGPVAGRRSPTPNPNTLNLEPLGTIRFEGDYVEITLPTGTIEIDPNPDDLSAPWYLVGPDGFVTSGEGDAVLSGRQTGDYTLGWGAIEGFTYPEPNPVVFTLEADQTTSHSGLYLSDPGGTTPTKGSILVSPYPDTANWTISGPGGFSDSGRGEIQYQELDPGDYTVQWQNLSGWESPSPSSQTQNLAGGESLHFVGTYWNGTEPAIASVNGSLANGSSVTIDGSNFGSHTLEVASSAGPGGWIEGNGSGTSFGSLSGAAGWDVGISSPIPARITTEQAHSGSNSVLARVVRSDGIWQSVMRYTHDSPFDEIWVSFWYWFDPVHTSTDSRTNFSANKWFRIGDSDVNNTCGEIYTGARWTGDKSGIANALIYSGQVPGSNLWNWDLTYRDIVDEERGVPLCTDCACGISGPNIGSCMGQSTGQNFPTPREWTRVVVRAKASDMDIHNGEFFFSVNKPGQTEEVSVDWSGLLTHSSGCTRFTVESWRHFQFQNYWDDNYGSDMAQAADFFYDDIYIQVGTQARIELGDRQNYEQCTQLETQTPTGWSENGATFELNHGSFAPGSDVYLFVVREDGVASPGRPITLGAANKLAR